MASTHINHLKHYLERVERFRQRANALTIGDSWFQYPVRFYPDLETRISSNARFGQRVNFLDDSFPGRDAKDIATMMPRWRRVAAKLQDDGRPFSLILLSLGGNDVIGLDFRTHLSDGSGRSGDQWPWNAEVPTLVRRWLDLAGLKRTFLRVADSYRLIIAMRDELAPGATIIAHTYADVTPMNKPFTFTPLRVRSGPWIWKYLTPLGLSDQEQKVLLRWLLESFHGLLRSVQAETTGFVLLDTRRELADPAEWDNEIHPLGPGFIHLADTFWVPAVEQALV